MKTLENIKDEYYTALENVETKSFDQYLKELYVQVYDAELNFLGYEENDLCHIPKNISQQL